MKHTRILAAAAASVAVPAVAAEFGRKNGGAEPDIKAIAQQLSDATNQVKAFAEDAKGRMEKGEELTASAKQAADEALVKFNELSAQMTEVEQKLARHGGDPEREARKSVGQLVTANDDVKSFMERAPSKGSVKVSGIKAVLTSATTDADGSAGDLVVADRQPNIIAPMLRRMTVRDLLMPGRTNGNTVEYPVETGFTNNAAAVAEGNLKPQSELKFDKRQLKIGTIAHWIPASKQILADAPMLQSYIDGRLRYGLAIEEERQLLLGDGTGDNLLGLIPQASAYAPHASLPAGATMIDKLRYAILQAALAECPATGHVLNPIDWANIETTKDDTGRYVIGNPQDGAEPRLWRLPVVETPSMQVDKFLTGGFAMAAQIFDREDVSVEISTEDRDNFVRNLVTILAEARLGLAVFRPEGLIYGDFGNVA